MNLISSRTPSVITTCILFAGLLTLWIYKFPLLQLPFFWDEGWSYAEAVWAMYNNHCCLLPECLPPDLFRGHPLWFYFMNAAAAQVFGFSPFVLHAFSLSVTSAFVIAFFFILKKFTNPVFALLGTFLLLSQEAFIVQSSFMLPEVFIAMMTIIPIYFLHTGRNFLYFLAATVLVFTKETGFVIICSVVLVTCILAINEYLRYDKKSIASIAGYLFMAGSPLLAGTAFYVYQKIIYGWYFFPEHLHLIDLSAGSALSHAGLIADFIFTGYRRKALTAISIFILLIGFLHLRRPRESLSKDIIKITGYLLTAFIFYFLFSLFNYILLRYLMVLLVIFIFIIALWSYQMHLLGYRFFHYILCGAIALSLYHDITFNPSWIDDVSLNYKDVIAVHKKAVNFMESRNAQLNKIFTIYEMRYNLTHPELFYLNGPPFVNVTSDVELKEDDDFSNTDYYIFSNLQLNQSNYEYVKSNPSVQLLEKYESGKAWCEIYARK